jgi:hypothetical protein
MGKTPPHLTPGLGKAKHGNLRQVWPQQQGHCYCPSQTSHGGNSAPRKGLKSGKFGERLGQEGICVSMDYRNYKRAGRVGSNPSVT